MSDKHPTENLVRALTLPSVVRAESTDKEGEPEAKLLVGQFARFNEWTEINSIFEGSFMERIDPKAFERTLANDMARVKVLYDHGHDPQLGNKPLGPIRSVSAGKDGVDYEVELIDTSYNRDFIEPAARAGLLGASFRMDVRGDSWLDPTEPSDHNPKMLPERTIEDIDLYEFGPVTFPAYESASATMRSRSDEFLGWMVNDVHFVQRFVERTNPHVLGKVLEEATKLGYTADALNEARNKQDANVATNGLTDGSTQTRSKSAAMLELLKLEGE